MYFDKSSRSSYALSFILSFNSSYIYLIAALHSSSLKADCHVIHQAALCTNNNCNDSNFISSQVLQWWYSFGWPIQVKIIFNMYKWYKTHVSVLSPCSLTNYSTTVCCANIFFNICFCIILSTCFLTDYLNAIYYFIFIWTWFMSCLFVVT